MGLQYRKTKVVLNYRESKPTMFKLSQLTYPAVTETQLINEISQSQGVSAPLSKAVIDALLNRMVHYMEIGHGVSLGKFGSFKPVFTSKVAETADEATEATIKGKKIQFYPGGAFRDMLKNLSVGAASTKTWDTEAVSAEKE